MQQKVYFTRLLNEVFHFLTIQLYYDDIPGSRPIMSDIICRRKFDFITHKYVSFLICLNKKLC